MLQLGLELGWLVAAVVLAARHQSALPSLNVVAPVLLATSVLPPSTAPVKVIAPEPVDTVVAPPRVVVPATLNALLVVAYVPLSVAPVSL